MVSKQRSRTFAAVVFLASALGLLACWFGAPIFPFGVCAFLVLSLVPGAAVFHLLSRGSTFLELTTAAVAMSPVLAAGAMTLAMLAGLPSREAVALVLVLSCVLGLAAAARTRTHERALDQRQAIALAVFFLVVCAAISYLPFTRDWWRVRSDAWFHGAVIAQIADFGIPPEDPYMIGMPLQYMWFFHVLVLALSKASGIGPFMVMALVNAQTLVGFGLAAFLFSAVFRKAFSHNFAALLTAVFGMNAAVWLFIPVKLARVFFGEVRGSEELVRTLPFAPFDVLSVRRFVQMGFTQEFLLDKFMVGTALSVALCMMAVLWWAAARYISTEKREYLVTAFVAAYGLVAFHTAIGVVAFGGIAGGLILLVVLRRFINGYGIGPVLKMVVALVVCGILLLPYLHSVTQAKTGDEALPLGLSWRKVAGILVSCALVIFLAAFQFQRIIRTKNLATYFLVWGTAAVTFMCIIIKLPAANAYDKFPFLVFFPLAVAGGWTIAEFAERVSSPRRRTLRYALTCLLAFGPLNIFMFAGYYNTAPILRMNDDEVRVGAWVGANTPRESVMIDSKPNVFLIVAGPRRYYLGARFFAESWGYDRGEILRRERVISDIYSPGDLEPTTLETLGAMPFPLYVIVRSDDASVDSAKFEWDSARFRRVFASGPVAVFETNRSACRAAAGTP